MINEVFNKMLHEELDEQLTFDGEKREFFMRAVRDENGELIGYYERYEYK